MKSTAERILVVFGLVVGSTLFSMLIPVLVGKLVVLMATYPGLSSGAVVSFAKLRNSGASLEEAAQEMSIDMSIAHAIEKLLRWIQGML